jgi:hypothetical protein
LLHQELYPLSLLTSNREGCLKQANSLHLDKQDAKLVVDWRPLVCIMKSIHKVNVKSSICGTNMKCSNCGLLCNNSSSNDQVLIFESGFSPNASLACFKSTNYVMPAFIFLNFYML